MKIPFAKNLSSFNLIFNELRMIFYIGVCILMLNYDHACSLDTFIIEQTCLERFP